MAKINLQFHADPAELVRDLLPAWLSTLPVYLAAETFFPEYSVIALDNEDLSRLSTGQISRVEVSLQPVNVDVRSGPDFVRANPDALAVTLGILSPEGLRESSLAAWTDDKETLRLWRSVRRRAASSLHSDAYVVNPSSGARQRARDHLHSSGAAALAAAGVPLLAAAGWNRYELIAQ